MLQEQQGCRAVGSEETETVVGMGMGGSFSGPSWSTVEAAALDVLKLLSFFAVLQRRKIQDVVLVSIVR